eukprot:scaffold241581_cov28-Tisochrysis_lutea.AAC.1
MPARRVRTAGTADVHPHSPCWVKHPGEQRGSLPPGGSHNLCIESPSCGVAQRNETCLSGTSAGRSAECVVASSDARCRDEGDTHLRGVEHEARPVERKDGRQPPVEEGGREPVAIVGAPLVRAAWRPFCVQQVAGPADVHICRRGSGRGGIWHEQGCTWAVSRLLHRGRGEASNRGRHVLARASCSPNWWTMMPASRMSLVACP